MTRTSQLDAYCAVLQLDALREEVVMSYRPTVEMLIAEFEEQHASLPKRSPRWQLPHDIRVELLDYANGEGPGPWFAAGGEGGAN